MTTKTHKWRSEMAAQVSKKDTVDIVKAFTEDLARVQDIAGKYGMTRQGIYKILHRCGVETPKTSRMKISCAACGKEIVRTRARIRKSKHHFCGFECYYAFLDAKQGGEYRYWRHGQRIARDTVGKYFRLQDGHVVHHKDRNTFNNTIQNLMVFANHGDHIRYHRLGPDYVRPLFDGDSLYAHTGANPSQPS